jgi:putative endonuclease
MHHLLVGKIGERHAVKYLSRNGYEILTRNYRTSVGEIDIIAKEKGTLAFVEVKTRSTRHYGLPQEAVGMRKKRQIIRTAHLFLNQHGDMDVLCRFDVVAIWLGISGRARRIELIRHAFDVNTHE